VAAVFVGALASVLSPAPGQAAGTFPGFLCKVDLVAVFPGKFVSVHCVPGDGTLAWFALSIANPDSSRVLSLAATAAADRRTLSITYDLNDTSGPAFGCFTQFNCQALQGVIMNRD
jgi:hypothetical protein